MRTQDRPLGEPVESEVIVDLSSVEVAGRDIDPADVLRLAAVRAALDPERELGRADILVSVVVEVLSRGSQSTESLRVEVNHVWATRSVTVEMVQRALEIAQRTNLVWHQTTLTDEQQWTLTDSAKEDAERDKAWAEQVFANFELDLGARLAEMQNLHLAPQQLSIVTHKLFCSLAACSSRGGTFFGARWPSS